MIITGVFTNTQLLFVVGVLLGCVHWTVGIRLLECSRTSTKVPENSVSALTCVDTPDSISWVVSSVKAASCNSSTCRTSQDFSHVLASRPNASTSVFHIDVTKYRDTGVNVQCGTSGGPYDQCHYISVYTEMPVSCQFNVSTESRRLSGACEIAKIFASDNQYHCGWNEVFNGQSDKVLEATFNSTLYTDSETGREYRRGECSFSSTFIAVQGVFKYTHHMDPGFHVHVATIVVHEASDITVSGPSFVATSVDGSPGSVEETTSIMTPTITTGQVTTPTTSDSGTGADKMTSISATASDTAPTTDGSEKTPGPQDTANDSNITAYVAGGVAGGLGLIIIVVLVVFGVLILRKMSDAKRGTVEGSAGRMARHDVSRPRACQTTERRLASMAEPEHFYSETYAEPVAPDPHTALQNDMGYLTAIPDNHEV